MLAICLGVGLQTHLAVARKCRPVGDQQFCLPFCQGDENLCDYGWTCEDEIVPSCIPPL